MSDSESSVVGPPPSRAGTAKTPEKRKVVSVDSSSDELDDAGFSTVRQEDSAGFMRKQLLRLNFFAEGKFKFFRAL